eukprot:2737508-Pyramimonas_sp.AAC.3
MRSPRTTRSASARSPAPCDFVRMSAGGPPSGSTQGQRGRAGFGFGTASQSTRATASARSAASTGPSSTP